MNRSVAKKTGKRVTGCWGRVTHRILKRQAWKAVRRLSRAEVVAGGDE